MPTVSNSGIHAVGQIIIVHIRSDGSHSTLLNLSFDLKNSTIQFFLLMVEIFAIVTIRAPHPIANITLTCVLLLNYVFETFYCHYLVLDLTADLVSYFISSLLFPPVILVHQFYQIRNGRSRFSTLSIYDFRQLIFLFVYQF